MKIVTLLENTAITSEYKSKHGLCFYIETKHHKILADLGPDDSFLENAKSMGIGIKDIDTVIISHGHDDHGGGLKTFFENNSKAKVYVAKDCFEDYYVSLNNENEYIGLEKALKDNNRINFVGDNLVIDDEISIFGNIKGGKCLSTANNILMRKENEVMKKDDFTHEICLVIKEDNKLALVGGCAHNGILNILERFEELYGRQPDYVISGFHLYNPSLNISEKDELITEISNELLKYNSSFFTCHCTGQHAYNVLKENMGEKIGYMSTGDVLNL